MEKNEKVEELIENNNVTEKKGLLQLVAERLRKMASDQKMEVDYLGLYAYAQEMLDQYLKEYDFPVQINSMVEEKLGIEVVYQPLNEDLQGDRGNIYKIVGRNLKRVNHFTGKAYSSILIDDSSNRAEQRYALAHEVAHYLIHLDEPFYNSEYCIMPMLFKQSDEMIADIFATFLLIPIPIFLKEFLGYIGDRAVPVQTSEWLKHLSIVTEVPYENVAIGYQTIRYVCGMVYRLKEGELLNICLKDDEIVQRQIEKIKDALTEEAIEKLFY